MNGRLFLVSDAEREFRDAGSQERLAGLVDAMGGGDESALEALYEETVNQVYGLVNRILNNDADAEEITEDVYLYAWRNPQGYDRSKGEPMAWLLTVARSRAVDRFRYKQRQIKLSEAVAAELAIAQVVDDVDEQYLSLCYDPKIKSCLNELPELQKQILTLAYFRGMTQAEISTMLSMSLGTVKTHIRRTLIAMREAVEA